MVTSKKLALVAIVICIGVAVLYKWPASYHVHVPCRLSGSNIPIIQMQIGECSYPVKMDLGSKFELSLYSFYLDSLEKTEAGCLSCRDMYGNHYDNPAYRIPSVRIESLSYDQVLVAQESPEFVANTTLWVKDPTAPPTHHIGAVGRGLLERKNLLLDIQKSSIFISNNRRKLRQAGYSFDHGTPIPFEIGATGIIVHANSSFGPIRLSLDTGSSVSFIRSSFVPDVTQYKNHGLSYTTCKTLSLEGQDFGSVDFYLLDLSPELTQIDGILGMPFLKNHVIYIDYTHRVLYIDK